MAVLRHITPIQALYLQITDRVALILKFTRESTQINYIRNKINLGSDDRLLPLLFIDDD